MSPNIFTAAKPKQTRPTQWPAPLSLFERFVSHGVIRGSINHNTVHEKRQCAMGCAGGFPASTIAKKEPAEAGQFVTMVTICYPTRDDSGFV